MAECFSSVSRVCFGSIGLHLAVGQVGVVIGPCCIRTVSRPRVGRSICDGLVPGPSSPFRIDVVTPVSADGSVAALEASPIPDHLISVVPLGRVEASQFIINEARGVAGENDIVEAGMRDDNGADVGEDGCSGAVIDSCYSGGHGGDVGTACGSANSVGSVVSGDVVGPMRAPSSGAMSAPSSRPTGPHSKEEGDCAGGACVLNSDGLACHVGGGAPFVHEAKFVDGSSPCGACDPSSLSAVGCQFVCTMWQVSPSGVTHYVPRPEAASSSSGGGVSRFDWPVIDKRGIACTYYGDGSVSSQSSVISRDPNGQCPNPYYFSHTINSKNITFVFGMFTRFHPREPSWRL